MMNIILDTATNNEVMVDYVDFADEIGTEADIVYWGVWQWLRHNKTTHHISDTEIEVGLFVNNRTNNTQHLKFSFRLYELMKADPDALTTFMVELSQ